MNNQEKALSTFDNGPKTIQAKILLGQHAVSHENLVQNNKTTFFQNFINRF